MAVTIRDGKEQAVSIEELRQHVNSQTRYIPQGQEIKIVTCNNAGFQQVFWVDSAEYQTVSKGEKAMATTEEHYAIGQSVKVIDGCFSPEYGEVRAVRYGAITGRIIYDVRLYTNNGTVPFFANEIRDCDEIDVENNTSKPNDDNQDKGYVRISY